MGLLAGSTARRAASNCLTPGEYWAGRGAVMPRMILMISAGRVGASNARLHEHSSYRMQPKAQISLFWLYGLPGIATKTRNENTKEY